MIKIKCNTCGTIFNVPPSRFKIGRVKYCSRKCYKRNGEKNPFYCKKHSIKSISKMSNHPNRPKFKSGIENPNYKKPKGESYVAIHRRIGVNFIKPNVCEHCKSDKVLEWANISGNYTEKREDWFALCRSCHKKFDNSSDRKGRKDFRKDNH